MPEPKFESKPVTPEDVERFKQETVERARAEGVKLERYGRIGQEVRIVGRSVSPRGEVVGKIFSIECNLPFDEETLRAWQEKPVDEKKSLLEGLPGSKVKVVAIDEGQRRIVENLVASEWESVE